MRFAPLLTLALFPSVAHAEQPAVAPQPRPVVFAAVESSLTTGGNRIRQFAFDANPATYFESEKNAAKDDHLTLRFDAPVAFTGAVIHVGRPNGEHHPGKRVVYE